MYTSIISQIGNTPLLRLEQEYNGENYTIYAKLEFLNPSGSVKDRIAIYIIEKAEERGILKKNSIIVEATSGNTGISLAMVAAAKGYKMLAVMPEHMSKERVRIIKSLGAEIILTPQKIGFPGAIAKTEEMAKKDNRIFLSRQFSNPDNVEAHKLTTGKEILEQMKGKKIDAFVGGIGTGGTLMGVREALKEVYPNVKIIAVEPAESPVLVGGKPGSHKIQGIGDDFIPEIVKLDKIDEIVHIHSNDAIKMAKELCQKKGLMVGISSGANMLASLRIAEKIGRPACQSAVGRDKNIVTVLPDRCERYFSTDLYKECE